MAQRPARGRPAAPQQVTIDSVAAHANVSRQTVSNALNAPAKLKPETLTRVTNSIQELGYRPNHAARTLRTQATRLIAWRLLPSNYGGTGGVFDSFLHALCGSARSFGYDILTFSAGNDDDEIAVYDDLLRRQAVDGIALTETHFIDPRTRWLRDRNAYFTAFGRPWGEARPRHSWVDVDGAAGVALAMDHLVAQGHRRIAFIGWPEGSGVGDDRQRGWQEAVARYRLPSRGLDVRGIDGIGVGAALTEVLLNRSTAPTAVMCVSDAMALGALHTVEDLGLKAGPDVAIVGFDDSPVAAVVRPGLTSLRQPLETVAEKVVELLLDDLHGRRTKPIGVLIPPTLTIRASSSRDHGNP